MKKLWIILAALLLLAGAVLGVRYVSIQHKEQKQLEAAEALYAQGSYGEARELFAQLGLSDRVESCDYRIKRVRLDTAIAAMNSGDTDAAREQFLSLGDFEDAAAYLPECDLREAAELRSRGDYEGAMDILSKIADYPAAVELMGQMRDELYSEALEATYACRMDEAITLWSKLGEYKDSMSLLARCRERVEALASECAEPVRYSEYAGTDLGKGRLYWHRIGLIYVPNECTPETPFLIFYPGGYDTSLANSYITEFLYGTPPDAVMLFSYANGLNDIDAKIEDSYRVLERAALENGLFIHDLVLCGASNGAYTATNAAAYLYDNYGIKAKCVMTFDAGMHWTLQEYLMTPEECDSTAEAGTGFMLFETAGIGMNRTAIQNLVTHGNDVTIVKCRNDGHYAIIYDAMDYGLIHWALGLGKLATVDNYTYIPLDRDSTYPD